MSLADIETIQNVFKQVSINNLLFTLSFQLLLKLRPRLNTQKCVIYTKIFIHKRYLILVVSKFYLKLVRATRGYNLTSEPQTLVAELPLS